MNLFKRSGALMVFIIAACGIPAYVAAGGQAERAVTIVKKMVDSGAIPENTVLRLVAKQGNIDNFWGKDLELKKEWEKRTGVLIDATVMPQAPVLEFLRAEKNLDITVARQYEYPDLFMEGLIADLTPYITKYDFRLDDNPLDGYFSPRSQSDFDGKVVAIPADGDIAMLYLRRDLMEDPEIRTRFRQTYHRDLTPPSTWAEYQGMIEFFHNPARGFYGTCEQRDPGTGWMFWMCRYASQADPNQFLFDDGMHPLLNTKQGVSATEGYLKTIAFSPPEITKQGNFYNYTVPIYVRGDAFAFISTMAVAKMLSLESSPLKNKWMCALMPGTVAGGKLVRRSSYIMGNNLVVCGSSKQKELAFLFAMWICDPDVSIRNITVTTGITDPFRFNHLKHPQVESRYSRQALGSLRDYLHIVTPAGTGLPGNNEYIASLSSCLWAASKGELSARAAMDRAAKEWEKITDTYGRERQIRYWRAFRKKYPAKTFSISDTEH